MNKILEKDLIEINQCKFINWKKIDNHSFLITGATGVLGSLMVKALLYRKSNIQLILPVRDVKKAKMMFGESKYIKYIETNIEDFVYNQDVDYVIHAASPTKSKYFITYPIETMNTIIKGTTAILEYIRQANIKSMVYVSSMEMYGTLENDNVDEDVLGYIDLHDVRSSYSEGKRVAELYCNSYANEYFVPVKIARLAMTFGAGLPDNENRVYKYFCDCILKRDNIVLKSTGDTLINFCYTTDALLAILKILTEGENGEAYNVCSDFINMTIKDSAEWLVDEFTNNDCKVIIDIPKEKSGFAPVNRMILNNEKLKKLGWIPDKDLKDGYRILMDYLKNE